jgi:hypothetical protein
MRADITITNIPTIMGIMDVMAIAMVITHPLDLATVTEEAIMAVILLMDGIMAVVMVVIEAVTAVAFMVAVLEAFMAAGLGVAFTVVIDKSRNGNDEIKRIL